ncbi:CocE/NonD family hydrolase [Aurantiacibacter poecillastricola]|uniref:CocE/NonD family hydrolase n=1 Tax=Aurantiacibacter poecillastricola TaxID=3064385 RepID=UPI00273D206F|nr:CocE/NonD family hydrolase [Aurantiacibacter sp. 219JJ12-13]MDP5261300.1 CocE/NonD family hydrolase [Aurantiacibacter sp. 219JJ12-13]
MTGAVRKSCFRHALGLAAVLAVLSLSGCMHGPVSPQPAVAASATYERHAYLVPVSDGTRLALSVYRPTTGGPHPTLLWILPERRETIDPRDGTITPVMSGAELAFFTSHGYAVALAEMRGGGASFGTRDLDRSPQLGRDGADIVEWISAQQWSDGTLGMIGSSYQGFIQYATAAHAPRGLRAIFPEIAGFDDYGSMFYPGGILNNALSSFASESMARSARNVFDPANRQLPAAPAVDEDRDGEWADEIPLDRDGDGSFLDEDAIVYADGQPRQHLYLEATRDHLDNTQLTLDRLAAAPHRDSTLAGTPYTYSDIDPANRPAAISRSGIAVYNRGGWFDYHARDTTLWFATLQGHTPTRLMMAPTGHGGLPEGEGEELYRAGPYFRHFGSTSTNTMMLGEKLAFFDRHVRGIGNGLDDVDPVLLYVMGEGWRREETWPLPRGVQTRFYFAEDGLAQAPPASVGARRYEVDFEVTSVSSGASRWNYGISRAEKPMTLDHDALRRTAFATAPLAEDTEVTGHPILELVLSSDLPEADVFAYLEDVAPDGTSLLVTEGQLRANYHGLRPISQMVSGEASSIAVRPDLPWQGFDASDYDAQPLADGQRLRLVFDLMPTSWVFRRGHRIRLSLAGADYPSFAVHPELEQARAAGDPPVWQIWWGPAQSYLELPIIPAVENDDEDN